ASMPVRNLCGGLFASTNPGAAFVLGLGVGFLPCPLPMGLLAVAALSHNIFHGMLLMGGMGLGTAPALLAVGFLGIGLDRKYARIGMKAAGLALVAIGLLIVIKASGIAAHPCCAAGMPS
ncbi:MAG TPA: sulfite exporter TauE/SafE family protein, partial [Armatimonadota bacterium]|nr:sulfite exporter TauE/SafE family protein [Armatimonadota bacterium]